jgi:PadR family transcriptional regulator
VRFRKELVGGTTNALILYVLNRAPAHGYEIVRTVNEESDGLFEWKEGTIYPALHKMEKAGHISGAWKQTPNGRKRRVYSITAAGKKVLSEQADEWSVYSTTVDKILGVSHA